MSTHTRSRTHSTDDRPLPTAHLLEPATDAGDATLAAFAPGAIPDDVDASDTDTETTTDSSTAATATLEDFTVRSFPRPAAESDSRPDELSADDAEAGQTTLTGSTDWSTAELAAFYEDQGKFPIEIATDLAGDLSRSEVADRLRRAGVLEPADDYRALHELYCERDWSTSEIAERACDGAVTSETIAYRLHQFGFHEERSQERLAAMDPDELDLETDDKALIDETAGREKRQVRA
ncbi:hypothetical protein [Natrinema saccharevitans]|uniref:hypothetical protein n=1 Tax=Natrinema saccharevitans TaxID=301967 RepID=UPI0011158C28|nr:hypothetical protein [Natrinema saccharevitans]